MLATQAGDTLVVLASPLEGTPADDRFNEYRTGVDHLAFGVDDRTTIEALVEGLEAAGVETAGIETDPALKQSGLLPSAIPTTCSGSSTKAEESESLEDRSWR